MLPGFSLFWLARCRSGPQLPLGAEALRRGCCVSFSLSLLPFTLLSLTLPSVSESEAQHSLLASALGISASWLLSLWLIPRPCLPLLTAAEHMVGALFTVLLFTSFLWKSPQCVSASTARGWPTGHCSACGWSSPFVSERPTLGLPSELYTWVGVWVQGYSMVFKGCCLLIVVRRSQSGWSSLRTMSLAKMLCCISKCWTGIKQFIFLLKFNVNFCAVSL